MNTRYRFNRSHRTVQALRRIACQHNRKRGVIFHRLAFRLGTVISAGSRTFFASGDGIVFITADRCYIAAVNKTHRLGGAIFFGSNIKENEFTTLHVLQLQPGLRKGAVGFQIYRATAALHA